MGDFDALRKIATGFRRAMEANRGEAHPRCLQVLGDFPRSCCHHACRFLARHLHELGFLAAEGRGGLLDGDGVRHNWIEVDGIVVDITADQFRCIDPRPPAVIVTTDRAIHGRFHPTEPVSYAETWHELGWDPEFPPAYDLEYGRIVSLLRRAPGRRRSR